MELCTALENRGSPDRLEVKLFVSRVCEGGEIPGGVIDGPLEKLQRTDRIGYRS